MFKKFKILSEINSQILDDTISLTDKCNNLIKYLHKNNNINYYNLNETINNLKYKDRGFIILLNHTCITTDYLLILSKLNVYSISLLGVFDMILFFSKLTYNKMMNRLKFIPYDKKNGEKVKQTMLEKINNGEIVQIYPEGKMSNKNNLNSFKKGSLDLAFKNNIPILPIIIDYKDDFYVNTESETDRLVHHLEDTSGIDIHTLDFIYPEDSNTFDLFHNKVYDTMNNFYVNLKNKPALN